MTSTLESPSRRLARNLRQFVQFGVVGGSGVVVNMLVALVMNKLNGGTVNSDNPLFKVAGWTFSFSLAVWIVGFFVSNVFNFQLNRSWTFRTSRPAGWWQEFWPFLAVGSVAALTGLFLKAALKSPRSPLYLSHPFFHEEAGLHSREYWAQLIAIVLVMPINFVVNKLWTFRHVRNRHAESTQADG